jgi:molybdopterin molybdotransferase
VSELITIAEARESVLESVPRLGDEAVALDAALGRVLAEDVTSAIAVPPFDSSAKGGAPLERNAPRGLGGADLHGGFGAGGCGRRGAG